jgi:hypothetical protein
VTISYSPWVPERQNVSKERRKGALEEDEERRKDSFNFLRLERRAGRRMRLSMLSVSHSRPGEKLSAPKQKRVCHSQATPRLSRFSSSDFSSSPLYERTSAVQASLRRRPYSFVASSARLKRPFLFEARSVEKRGVVAELPP